MVSFIPPYMGEEIKSAAEKKMFGILQTLKMNNAYVLHSLGLPRHNSKIYGEVDFVVICERGIACLEIKGGRVECKDGKWLFTDRYGVEREKPEGPFAQVVGNMFSLKKNLKDRFPNNNIKNTLVACGVVFPDIEFKSSSEEIISEIIFDSKTSSITEYINRVFDYWESRQHRPPNRLSSADITLILNYLRCNFTFVPTLESRLDCIEQHLIRLTAEQVQIMDALAENKHILIEGNAGTGKTLLAVDFAEKKAEQGKKILYLTYNKNLAYSVQKKFKENSNVKVINIHALFGEHIPVDSVAVKENSKNYFAEILPQQFFDYYSSLSKQEIEALSYDLLVVDEGQDILNPIYLYSIDLLLKGGFENGNWAVFYDEKQNLFNPEFENGMEILRGYQSTKFKLFTNCRNTVQIGNFTSKISGIELPEFIRENGEEVQKISYQDFDEFKKQINQILKYLRNDKIDLKDVVFLSPKKYKNSILSKAGIAVNELQDGYDSSIQLPVYATIQGYKGLDSKIVILIDVDEITDYNFSRFLYISGTRARALLYIIGSNDFWNAHI